MATLIFLGIISFGAYKLWTLDRNVARILAVMDLATLRNLEHKD